MAEGCKTPNCTVAVTGICILENDPKTCPERIATDIDVSALTAGTDEILPQPESMPTFPASITMSLEDISTMMAEKYCKLVGILGAPESGKTATLVCLYLLLARSKMRGYKMLESDTIMGLEQISRGARRWRTGDAPGTLTVHTDLSNERAAGFLHLRLAQTDTGEIADILFPDLPGEWSTSLIDKNDKDRLAFLRAADCIWVMADGVELTALASRQGVLHRLGLLLQRVKALVGADHPAISLVITRRDKGAIAEAAYSTLLDEAHSLGIDLKVFQIASFSEEDTVEPGAGIPDLIDSLFVTPADKAEFWPSSPRPAVGRQFMRYRSAGAE